MKYKWLMAGGLGVGMLLLCILTVGIFWASIGLAQSDGLRWRVFAVDSTSAEAEEETRYPVHTPAALVVENPTGNVTVVGGEGAEVVVRAHKTAWGATQAEAEAALKLLTITVTQAKDEVTIKVTQPDDVIVIGYTRSNMVDFVIEVPRDTAVTVEAAFGNVAVSDTTRGVAINTNAGRVTVENVTGDVNIVADFGNTTLKAAQVGNVTIESKSGGITLLEVEATGAMLLTSDFGMVSFTEGQAPSLTVEAKSGEIELTNVVIEGLVKINDDFGGVRLKQVRADAYTLETKSGAVSVEGASGSVTAHSDFGEVTVTGGVEVTLQLSSKNGALTYEGSLGAGPHMLESGFGNIRLTVPAETTLTLDLQTDFGKITSDLLVAMQTTGELSNDHISGTTNGGGASLTAQTKNGSITLEVLKP